MNDAIQRLNYCSAAIESLREQSKIYSKTMPLSADAIEAVADMLEMSQKFILPPFAELLERGTRGEEHSDLIVLPFPVTAFEYSVPYVRTSKEMAPKAGAEQSAAPKRISLCFTVDQSNKINATAELLEEHPEGGIFVLSIYSTAGEEAWRVCDGYLFLPFGAKHSDVIPNESSAAAKEALEAAKLARSNSNLEMHCGPFLPEMYELRVRERGETLARTDIMLDVADEANAMMDACIVLSCENAEIETMPAPKSLNKKRQKRGKLPLFEYKVLAISGGTSGGVNRSGDGRHRSPRTHVRRAHLRRLKDKVVLVRSAVVNPNASAGVVHKDYKLD